MRWGHEDVILWSQPAAAHLLFYEPGSHALFTGRESISWQRFQRTFVPVSTCNCIYLYLPVSIPTCTCPYLPVTASPAPVADPFLLRGVVLETEGQNKPRQIKCTVHATDPRVNLTDLFFDMVNGQLIAFKQHFAFIQSTLQLPYIAKQHYHIPVPR